MKMYFGTGNFILNYYHYAYLVMLTFFLFEQSYFEQMNVVS